MTIRLGTLPVALRGAAGAAGAGAMTRGCYLVQSSPSLRCGAWAVHSSMHCPPFPLTMRMVTWWTMRWSLHFHWQDVFPKGVIATRTIAHCYHPRHVCVGLQPQFWVYFVLVHPLLLTPCFQLYNSTTHTLNLTLNNYSSNHSGNWGLRPRPRIRTRQFRQRISEPCFWICLRQILASGQFEKCQGLWLAETISTTTFTMTTNMYSLPSHQQQPFWESEIKLDLDSATSATSATSSSNSAHPLHNTTMSPVPDLSQHVPGWYALTHYSTVLWQWHH